MLLIASCLIFYILPWGSFDSTVSTNFGTGNYLSNPYTGFNLGLFTYSFPITIINIILLIFILNNNLKYKGIISIIGLVASLVAVENTLQVGSLHTSFSSQFGSVSADVTATGWAYLLPLSYFLLLIVNITANKGVGADLVFTNFNATLNLIKVNIGIGTVLFFIDLALYDNHEYDWIAGLSTITLGLSGLLYTQQKDVLANKVSEETKLKIFQLSIFTLTVNLIMSASILLALMTVHSFNKIHHTTLLISFFLYSINVLLMSIRIKKMDFQPYREVAFDK